MEAIQKLTKFRLALPKNWCKPFSSLKERVPIESSNDTTPRIIERVLRFPPKYQKPREVWVESLGDTQQINKGITTLHPDIFAVLPRIDIIHQNVTWQTLYRSVSYAQAKTRAEVRGGGRKPWPQKGMGKARQGSIRAPQWRGGGKVHGPRGPKTHFYMLDVMKRVRGLTSVLSAKLAQDDLHIVDSLDIPTDDPQYLTELAEKRNWGSSILFVDESDIMPRNITASTDSIGHFNLMPSYGLNVYSMLKHHTLVLTIDAVNHIEEKLLTRLNQHRDPDKKRLLL